MKPRRRGRCRRQPGREHGFSLLEILIAFSIMAFSLGVLYRSIGGSLFAFERAELKLKAVLVAESLLNGYETVSAAGVDQSGVFDDAFYWRVSSMPAAEGAVALQRLNITVSWNHRSSMSEYRLVTLRPASREGRR